MFSTTEVVTFGVLIGFAIGVVVTTIYYLVFTERDYPDEPSPAMRKAGGDAMSAYYGAANADDAAADVFRTMIAADKAENSHG